MPRRDAFDADAGDDGILPPGRFTTGGRRGSGNNSGNSNPFLDPPRRRNDVEDDNGKEEEEEDPDLVELERRLNEEVDEDFFEEPRRFNTLHRVIDVLGLKMIDDATCASDNSDLEKNPAYRNLRDQQKVVEGAIEHMAVIHCADLNGSVIQVGRVARQFTDAVGKVRSLRKQVRDIQDSLGGQNNQANPNEAAAASGGEGAAGSGGSSSSSSRPQNAAAMSLREMWMKKLECEATLSLLDKLDVIRAAPSRFDQLTAPPCRIGAAVLTITAALQTMFSDDVAQVQALHKIMEQLLLRKQKAEEIIWDTLHDVVYLRTGNGLLTNEEEGDNDGGGNNNSGGNTKAKSSASANKATGVSGGHSVSSESRRSARVSFRAAASSTVHRSAGMVNPFTAKNMRFAVDEDLDNDAASVDSEGSGASLFSLEDGDEDSVSAAAAAGAAGGSGTNAGAGSGAGSGSHHRANLMRSLSNPSVPGGSGKAGGGGEAGPTTSGAAGRRLLMIPVPMIEAELDLEADERRCLEEIALSGMALTGQQRGARHLHHHHKRQALPRYADPVLALRILVECLAQLRRLDDVERVLQEGLAHEIRQIVQREQARTFTRLERNKLLLKKKARLFQQQQHADNLKEFRRHLTGLMSAFGCVMLRLSHLAEILRFRMSTDKELMAKMGSASSTLRPVLSEAYRLMQKEIKEFLQACLSESKSEEAAAAAAAEALESTVGSSRYETGLFSLGIVQDHHGGGGGNSGNTGKGGSKGGGPDSLLSTATRGTVMQMSGAVFVSKVLFPKTKSEPQIRHALTFRRSVARWTSEIDALNRELAGLTFEDTSSPSFRQSVSSSAGENNAIGFLDKVIQNDLLPVLQEDAVNGTVHSLERPEAFDPVLDRTLYSRPNNSNEAFAVDMCLACQALYKSTGPLFLALHRLPRGGDMYLPLVAVLEHVMLTFISRVKQQVNKICSGKTAFLLLGEEKNGVAFAQVLEQRKPFRLLLRAYADGEAHENAAGAAAASSSPTGGDDHQAGFVPLAPPAADTAPRSGAGGADLKTGGSDVAEDADGVEGEEAVLDQELAFLEPYLTFGESEAKKKRVIVSSDEDLMKASCLAHSLLKLSSLLESRLMVRGHHHASSRTLTSTRALREAIKTLKLNGVKMAKFCRLDMLMQTVTRLEKICTSSTLVARDAVRIPSSVNDLGEYLTGASDNLREACGHACTAYTLSSLEQYIPVCLMETVRAVCLGRGIVTKSPLTMNGIEALDRSGSVLYRDLKGATAFDHSFWDVELAAVSFERSASFIAMMELEMEELVAYYAANQGDFSEEDYKLMFRFTGPRRRGDISRYEMMKRKRVGGKKM